MSYSRQDSDLFVVLLTLETKAWALGKSSVGRTVAGRATPTTAITSNEKCQTQGDCNFTDVKVRCDARYRRCTDGGTDVDRERDHADQSTYEELFEQAPILWILLPESTRPKEGYLGKTPTP